MVDSATQATRVTAMRHFSRVMMHPPQGALSTDAADPVATFKPPVDLILAAGPAPWLAVNPTQWQYSTYPPFNDLSKARATLTGITVTNANPSIATCTSRTFVSGDVGATLYIWNGTKIVAGNYTIASVTDGNATLNANATDGTGSGADGVGCFGSPYVCVGFEDIRAEIAEKVLRGLTGTGFVGLMLDEVYQTCYCPSCVEQHNAAPYNGNWTTYNKAKCTALVTAIHNAIPESMPMGCCCTNGVGEYAAGLDWITWGNNGLVDWLAIQLPTYSTVYFANWLPEFVYEAYPNTVLPVLYNRWTGWSGTPPSLDVQRANVACCKAQSPPLDWMGYTFDIAELVDEAWQYNKQATNGELSIWADRTFKPVLIRKA